MRIGYLCHKYPLGNVKGASFVHELARAVAGHGHEVHILVPAGASGPGVITMNDVIVHACLPPMKLMHNMSVDDSYVQRPRLEMLGFVWRSITALRRLIARQQLDIVHAHWAVPMGFVATSIKWLHRLPVVVTAHGRDLYLNALDGSTKPPSWARPLTGLTLRLADRVIFTTPDYADLGRSYGVRPDRLIVIPNGVDLDLFRPELSNFTLRTQLDCELTDCLLLYVGSLDEKKGLMVLLDALAHLVQSGTPVHLAVVGDGPLRSALEDRIRALCMAEHVTLLGLMDYRDLPSVYAACDVYVQPSLLEPFGVVVLEASASGKPVVASSVPGLRRVVADGESGVLVPPGDAASLARAIRRLAESVQLREEMGGRGRQRVEAEYSWWRVAELTVECYRDVISALSGPR